MSEKLPPTTCMRSSRPPLELLPRDSPLMHEKVGADKWHAAAPRQEAAHLVLLKVVGLDRILAQLHGALDGLLAAHHQP